MALPQPKSHSLPHAEERRRHQRVRVNLLGRYMLADRREFPCQVVNMSPGGIALIARLRATSAIGSSPMGPSRPLEGHLARLLQNGFAMTILATPRKRDMLAAQLTWLANRSILNLPEDRRHGRFVPRSPVARLIMPNGTNNRGSDHRHLAVRRGHRHRRTPRDRRPRNDRQDTGRVVRHLEAGFAIEFTRLQHPDSVEENATGQ